MQYTREQAVGTPFPVTFADGLKVNMHPLNDEDISALDMWVRARFIETARASLPKRASKEEREETLSVAMGQAQGLTWMSGVGSTILATIDGLTQLVWQASHDPTLDIIRLRTQLFDPVNAERAHDAFRQVNAAALKKGLPPRGQTRPLGKRKSTGASRKGTGGRRK